MLWKILMFEIVLHLQNNILYKMHTNFIVCIKFRSAFQTGTM